MTAFDRIYSGTEALDEIFDSIRLGDNVVWQLAELEEFHVFVDPYVRQAIADDRNLIYMRFASHDPIVEDQPGVKTYHLDPDRGFEAFTLECREIITKEGRDAFYVFDCLSELQAAWSADMMMGNFFFLTCPYLFELDTVAFFPLLRGCHSFETVAKIRDTTQLLIDVCPDEGDSLFIHPLKVWHRYSTTMFMPHRFDPTTGVATVLTAGVDTARFYERMNETSLGASELNVDSWDRFFLHARMAHDTGTLDAETCSKMCNMMMTKDPRMRDMVKRFFGPDDYFAVRDRMVGTGLVGGKACGMLLARRIVETCLGEYHTFFEPHDSYYIGTDVFYTYIVENGLWPLRIAQRSADGFVSAGPALQEGIEQGTFPNSIRENLERILDYYGQCPIIVRSSSFLEDGFGNAFAGKYESVFCPNVGSFEERLEEFENAIKHVYASMMDPSALEYRRRNGLDAREEQMALLVQRVSGSHYTREVAPVDGGKPQVSDYFMPTAAGVGYSHSAYCWMEGMDPSAGMLRLVMGLGTKAVDRTPHDYPRLLSLDRPLATTAKNTAEKHRFSQRTANYIDIAARAFSEASVLDILPALPTDAQRAVFEHDRDAERRLREQGRQQQVLFASCQGLAENATFIKLMRAMLGTLEEAYGCPVDVEYAINVGEGGSFVVNLLQCRPLQTIGNSASVDVPELPASDIVLDTVDASMGESSELDIDYVAVVDPMSYYQCPYSEKPQVASLVSQVSHAMGDKQATCLLFAPGRIGTSSPELGVPVSFADICNFNGIFEVGFSDAGYSPELSYGSHMFQDLVEAGILYGAVFENEKTRCYAPQRLDTLAVAADLDNGMVKVFDARGTNLRLWHDMVSNRMQLGFDSRSHK